MLRTIKTFLSEGYGVVLEVLYVVFWCLRHLMVHVLHKNMLIFLTVVKEAIG